MRLPNLRLNSLRLLIILLLAIGIVCRCVNLEQKIYWGDETYTSLRISGYTERELREQIYTGEVINITDLEKFQRLSTQKSLTDTLNGLATEEPQLTPLYFIMVRYWVTWFGDSVAVIRSLLACLSLLAFPCIYWLSEELFASPLVSWIAMGLVAVSPMHLVYAQEARPYYLWILTILLSHAALLYSRRRSTIVGWGIYAVSVALGLYSQLLFVLVMAGQGLYLLLLEGWRGRKKLIGYVIACFLGLLAFLPWILVIFHNWSATKTVRGWTSQAVNLLTLGKAWLGDLSRLFFDLGSAEALTYIVLPIIFIIILVLYSLYFVCRYAPKQAWLLIICTIATTGLSLIISDLIKGGQLSTIARYLLPSYLSIQLAVAYTLGKKIISFVGRVWQQRFWQLLLSLLLTMGVLSCVVSTQSQQWWNKAPTYSYPQVAKIINQAPQPLLISNTGPGNILPLTYLLKPEVHLQLVSANQQVQVAQDFPNIFVYRPSKSMQKQLESEKYQLTPVHPRAKLWQIKK